MLNDNYKGEVINNEVIKAITDLYYKKLFRIIRIIYNKNY